MWLEYPNGYKCLFSANKSFSFSSAAILLTNWQVKVRPYVEVLSAIRLMLLSAQRKLETVQQQIYQQATWKTITFLEPIKKKKKPTIQHYFSYVNHWEDNKKILWVIFL